MAKQWVRHEIKRNEIAVFLQKSFEFYQKNRERVIVGAGIVLIIVILLVYFIIQYLSLNMRAWEQIAMATGLAQRGEITSAESKFLEIAQQFSRTPAAIHALIYLGDLYNIQKEYQKAHDAYERIIQNHRNKILLPYAYVGSGAALQNMGNLDKAAETYQIFVTQYPDHFLYPSILQSLAYCLEKTNQIAEARTQYEKIVTLFPQTIWSDNAYIWLNLIEEKK